MRRAGQGTSVALLAALLALALPLAAAAEDLESSLGKSEVRVESAAFVIVPGGTVTGYDLPGRLARLGYDRARGRRPAAPGEYFWGHERFWIYRRAQQARGRDEAAKLIGLALRRGDGAILGPAVPDGGDVDESDLWIDAELLAESLTEARAPRELLSLDELPEIVWRAVLAAEDGRFFEHSGLDARSIARAMLKNARAGKVVQGGSTITQQLVKIRDLTPKRTFGRKVSEAVRALALEAEYDKREILTAYLNAVYYGHVEGAAVHGIGAASRAYFSKAAAELDLREAALLAALIQGPNRLHPVRHADRALQRQRWVLGRLLELGWAPRTAVERARRHGLPELRFDPPPRPPAPQFLAWVRDEVARRVPKRVEERRGARVSTSLDPYLQELARRTVEEGLAELRRAHRRLRGGSLSAALVALDASSGSVLAYVGGDPARRGDRFDRVRQARRQPGSTVKPLIVLEAFDDCGAREPLHAARRVADRPLRLELESGAWEPRNPDGGFRGEVTLRRALVESLNVPLVRVARWCGFDATAARFARAGLSLPEAVPPAFVLGAVEASPLELAAAYSIFANRGRRVTPRPVEWIGRPSGRGIARPGERARKASSPGTAYLVRDLLEDAVARGTARAAGVEGWAAFGKTGTSSDERDAWLVGGAGSVVTAVWVGLDDGTRLGLSGSRAAAPLWRRFMERAVEARPAFPNERPSRVVEHWVEETTGRRLRGPRAGARRELFRFGVEPPKPRWLRRARLEPVIE